EFSHVFFDFFLGEIIALARVADRVAAHILELLLPVRQPCCGFTALNGSGVLCDHWRRGDRSLLTIVYFTQRFWCGQRFCRRGTTSYTAELRPSYRRGHPRFEHQLTRVRCDDSVARREFNHFVDDLLICSVEPHAFQKIADFAHGPDAREEGVVQR